MKRYLVMLVGIILLAGGILFQEQHHAATIQNHIPPPVPEYPGLLVQPVLPESHFADNVNLWGSPQMTTPVPDLTYADVMLQNDVVPAGFDKIHLKSGDKTEPVLTVQDREAAYSIFAAGGFKLTVNLKPTYPTPQAFWPTRIDPSIGGSFSF